MDLGYARVSTGRQSLDAELDRLHATGIKQVFTDKRSRKNTDRPGLTALLDCARAAALDRSVPAGPPMKLDPDAIYLRDI